MLLEFLRCFTVSVRIAAPSPWAWEAPAAPPKKDPTANRSSGRQVHSPAPREQPDHQHHAQALHDPHLPECRRQRAVPLLDLAVGILKPAVLLFRRLRHAQFGFPQLAQFRYVAEHRNDRNRTRSIVLLPRPEIGGGDRERAVPAFALHLDHAPPGVAPLHRGVENELREVVEAVARDEQLSEGAPVRLPRFEAQYAFRRRVERLDPAAGPDDQHPVQQVVERAAMDVRNRHRPNRSMLMLQRSSVVPSALR